MDTYIKTIINGLKAWVTSCLSRLESSVSGNLATMADKLTSLSSKVQQAQTTATNAQSTATQAQTTANQAQNTAQSAQTTANQAQNTAQSAQTTATQMDGKTRYKNGEVLFYVTSSPNTGTLNAKLPWEKRSDKNDGDYYLVCIGATHTSISRILTDRADTYINFPTAVTIADGDIVRIRTVGLETYRAIKTGNNIYAPSTPSGGEVTT